MAFVEGTTLRERMPTLSMKQAIDLAIQIADGLSAAHEKGIVHRDIKPENVMVRKDGIAQIMDFGLAKLRASGSKITRLTKQGSTVGTAGYMSPEQVQGQETDHRSDIFSFGVLVYEMLTGQLPFKGVHETALAYEIVNVDPAPMASIKPELDPALDAIVLECLEKDVRERAQSISQVAVDLKRYKRESSRQRMSRVTAARPAMTATGPARPAQSVDDGPRRTGYLPWIVASILAVSLVALGIIHFRSPAGSAMISAAILPPDGMNFLFYGNNSGPAALSPDGKQLAFTATDSNGKRYLYLRTISEPVPRRLGGTEGALYPFWSPDNQKLAFFSGDKLKKMDAAGGVPVVICAGGNPRGASWGSKGDIVFSNSPNAPLVTVSSAGGEPAQITRFDTVGRDNSHRWPSFLPDGEHFLYLARTVPGGTQDEGGFIHIASVDGKMDRALAPAVSNAVYVPGNILYVRGTTLVAHEFDEGSLELKGEPRAIAEGVCYDPSTNRATFTASLNGTLVYQTGVAQLGSRLEFRDRSGKLPEVVTPLAEYYYPRLSPDDSRVAVYIWDFDSHNADIWIFDILRGLRTRFTFSPAAEVSGIWSPDGMRMAFNSNRDGHLDLYVKSTTGAGAEEVVFKNDHNKFLSDWSRDGKFLTYTEEGVPSTQYDLWMLPMTGDRKPVPFLKTEFSEGNARFSPNGRWVAYVSDESGRYEVYIRPFDGPGGKWQVSVAGGDAPCWRKDGRELYYYSADNMVTVADIEEKAGSIEVSHVRPLFEVPSIIQAPTTDFIATSDGKKFLMNIPYYRQNQTPLTLVLNWNELLTPQ